MGSGLVRMRIVAALGDVIDARGKPAGDETGDQAQTLAKLISGVIGLGLRFTGDFEDFVGAELGVEGDALQEIEGASLVFG